ncbi:MAG: hypothetical protein JXB33_03815 [Clostridia bacterium]|nr:hypothetical protein [Clostridia bacterium]
MLTRGYWLIVHVRIKKFRLWLPMPLYVLSELIWQIVELAELFGWASARFRKYRKAVPVLMDFIESIGGGGRYDLVEIEADGGDGNRVMISVKVR